jgi:cyclase
MPIPVWPTELREVAEGVFAYVQAGGGFCVSNAGVVVGEREAVAIDALFSPPMTRSFRDALASAGLPPVRTLIDTHHHVDHTLGNALFPEAVVVAHAKARDQMERTGLPKDRILAIAPHFGPELEGARVRLPDIAIEGAATVWAGGKRMELLHFGTAHTVGDVLVYLPAERVLFTGDVAFHYVTPLAFEGHIGRWIEVCRRVEAMDVDVVVPGHGPVGTRDDVARMRGYLDLIHREARAAFDEGASPEEAARRIRLGDYAGWAEPERLAINVARLYQEFRGELADLETKGPTLPRRS